MASPDAFCKYIENNKLEIDTKLAEKSIRPIAIGRKIISSPDHSQCSACWHDLFPDRNLQNKKHRTFLMAEKYFWNHARLQSQQTGKITSQN